LSKSQSHRKAIESLEPRRLFAAVGAAGVGADVAALRGLERVEAAPAAKLETWPLQSPGVLRSGRTLYIRGTDADDGIAIGRVAGARATAEAPRQVRINFNTLLIPLQPSFAIKRVLINGLGGNDLIEFQAGIHRSFRPRVVVVRGGLGNDIIRGSAVNDYILGEAGNDTLDGREGKDAIDGGDGNDIITGGNGPDVLIGRTGDDGFTNFEGFDARGTGILSPHDEIFPGPGTDTAQSDPADVIHDDTP